MIPMTTRDQVRDAIELMDTLIGTPQAVREGKCTTTKFVDLYFHACRSMQAKQFAVAVDRACAGEAQWFPPPGRLRELMPNPEIEATVFPPEPEVSPEDIAHGREVMARIMAKCKEEVRR